MTVIRGKVLLAGNSAVGKSAWLHLFGGENVVFPKNYVATTGVNVVLKKIPLPEKDIVVELFFLDLGGQEIYREKIQSFLAGEENTMMVAMYDITKRDSFRAITQWLTHCNYRPDGNQPGVLIANKIDLEERAIVNTDEGNALAIHQHLEFFEISVKENKNFDAPFMYLAKSLAKKYEETVKEFEES